MSQADNPTQGQAPEKICPNCGGTNDAEALVCPWCGSAFPVQAPPQQQYPPQQYYGYGQPPEYAYPPQYATPPYQQFPTVIVYQRRRTGLIIASIIALVVICPVAIALGTLSYSISKVASIAQIEPLSPQVSKPSVANSGQTVKVGSWNITFERAEKTRSIDWSGHGNREQAQGVFVKVYLTEQNVTNEIATAKQGDFRLHDSGGTAYDVCATFACLAYPSQEGRSYYKSSIQPHNNGKLLLVFDVPDSANGFELVVHDSAHITLGNVAARP